MKRIWKYPFEIDNEITVQMPAEAQIVRIECQGGIPCIWALVDPIAPTIMRKFYIFKTGFEIPDGYLHWASFEKGIFVWHVFEAMRNMR
jgi:hypothetical protein